jgi:hypothetical protein
MVEILHVYFIKIHQLILYVFLAENKNLIFFPTVQRLKKISREGSSNQTTDAKRHFCAFLN